MMPAIWIYFSFTDIIVQLSDGNGYSEIANMTPKTGRKFTGLYFQIIITLFVLLSALSLTSNAQTVADSQPADGDWMRIATDDGSLSVEIPKEYRMFYDADGFLVSTDYHSFRLKTAFILSSYNKGTVIGIEIFDGDSGAMREMYSSDRGSWGLKKAPDIKGKGYTIRQLRQSSDKYYALRQYFHVNGKVVILTAASRKGNTDEMKRFFNSVSINLDGNAQDQSSILLSKLLRTAVPITVDLKDEPGSQIQIRKRTLMPL